MSGSAEVIELSREMATSGLRLDSLDQLHDLQQLVGQVLALRTLLKVMTAAQDPETKRRAASDILRYAGEEPEKTANRLRASHFSDLSMEELERVVEEGNLAALEG